MNSPETTSHPSQDKEIEQSQLQTPSRLKLLRIKLQENSIIKKLKDFSRSLGEKKPDNPYEERIKEVKRYIDQPITDRELVTLVQSISYRDSKNDKPFDPQAEQNKSLEQNQNDKTQKKPRKRSDKERLRNTQEDTHMLVGYLLNKTRERITEELKERSGKEFDFKKEEKQIAAILNLMDGNHVQMGTGVGKSSVILPVVATAHALLLEENSLLATVNPTLLAELKKHLEKQISSLPVEVRPQIAEVPNEQPKRERPPGKSFWEQMLWTPKRYPPLSGIDPDTKQRIPTVFLSEQNTLVHLSMNHPEYKKDMPYNYWDEGHVLFDRNSPHVSTQKTELTPDQKQEYAHPWIVARLISQSLKEKDFEIRNKSYQVKESSSQRIETDTIGLLNILVNAPDDDIESQQKLRKMVRQVTKDKKETTRTIQSFKRWWKASQVSLDVDERPDERKARWKLTLVQTIVNDLARFKNIEEGKAYTYSQDNRVKVRDSYLGLSLLGHQFDPITQLIITARDGKFIPVPLETKAGQRSHISTYIASFLEGNISMTSGTFLYTDIKKTDKQRKTRESALATFLQNHTHGEVKALDFTPKNPPTPEALFTNNTGAARALAQRLWEDSHNKDRNKPHQPTLITCWDEKEALDLKDALGKVNKGEFKDQIAVVNEDTTEEAEKEIYNKMENVNKQSQEARFVITTGKTSIGADIQARDLRVVLFNMPQTRLQIYQALGRRRDEGDDSLWYITKPSLQKFLNTLEPNSPFIGSNKKTFDHVLDLVLSQNPVQRLEGLDLAFDTYEKTLLADNEFDIQIDLFYEKTYRPRANEIVERIIKGYFADKTFLAKLSLNDPFKRKILEALARHNSPDIEQYIDNFAKKGIQTLVGLPDSLYSNIYQALGRVQSSGLEDALKKLPLELFPSLDQQLQLWIEDNIEDAVDNFNQRFTRIQEKIPPDLVPLEFNIATPVWQEVFGTVSPIGKLNVDFETSQMGFTAYCKNFLGAADKAVVTKEDGRLILKADPEKISPPNEDISLNVEDFMKKGTRSQSVIGRDGKRYPIIPLPTMPQIAGLLLKSDKTFLTVPENQSVRSISIFDMEDFNENDKRGLVPHWILYATTPLSYPTGA